MRTYLRVVRVGRVLQDLLGNINFDVKNADLRVLN